MKKSEYIEKVLEQVRCKSVHEPLKRELEAHIDDQAEAFISVGLPEAEAEEEAVKTMGDAVDTGVRLDSAHRPRFPMSAAVIALLLMAAGFAARVFVSRNFYYYNENSFYAAVSIPLALAAMAACYFMDYTIFTKFPKIACGVFFGGLTVLCAARCNKLVIWENVYHSDVDAAGRTFFFGAMLLAPFICGFVWSMRGKGFGGFAVSCLVSVIPAAFAALWIPCLSAAVLVGVSALAIMTYAVKNDFFRVKKLHAYIFMHLPTAIVVFLLFAVKYMNPMFFVDGTSNPNVMYGFCTSYNGYWWLADAFKKARLFGSSLTPEMMTMIPAPQSQFLLTAVIIRLGWAAGIAVSLLLLSLPISMLVKAAGIKNVFGRMTAVSAGIVFLFVTVSYIASNVGLTTGVASVTAPPFMTASPLNAVSSGALLGIFMSAYGKKDLFPERKIEARSNTAIKG